MVLTKIKPQMGLNNNRLKLGKSVEGGNNKREEIIIIRTSKKRAMIFRYICDE
jgi:hypothetical protein